MSEKSQLITREDGMLLSMLALSSDISTLSEEKKASFLDRGLIKMRDRSFTLEKDAMDAISLHPLFGESDMHLVFPESLHDVLLSETEEIDFLKEGLSDYSEDERAAIIENNRKAIEELGLSTFSEKERFLSLSLPSRFAYLINKRRSESAKLAVLLAMELDGADEDVLQLIKKASGCSSEDISKLLSLGIVVKRGGLLYGSKENKEECSLTVTSDFTVITRGRISVPLFAFATPIMFGTVTEWNITKESIKKALLMGLTSHDIAAFLKTGSASTIPEGVILRIESWEESLSSVKGEEVIMLNVSERAGRIISALHTLIEEDIIANPVPSIYIMKKSAVHHWSAVLSEVGLDVLGDIPREEEEEREPLLFEEKEIQLPLPQKRQVPFNETLCNALLETEDVYRKIMVLSGFIYSSEMKTPELKDVVLGLDYQEKKRIIHQTIMHGGKIYAEFIDGSIIIAQPLKSERDGYVFLGDEEIEIAKIWKLTHLPLSVVSFSYQGSLDNDSL